MRYLRKQTGSVELSVAVVTLICLSLGAGYVFNQTAKNQRALANSQKQDDLFYLSEIVAISNYKGYRLNPVLREGERNVNFENSYSSLIRGGGRGSAIVADVGASVSGLAQTSRLDNGNSLARGYTGENLSSIQRNLVDRNLLQFCGSLTPPPSLTGPRSVYSNQVCLEQALPPTCTLTASPANINAGASSTLSLQTRGLVSSATLEGTAIAFPNGSRVVRPGVTTRYTATITGPGGTSTCFADVTITTPAPTCTLIASPMTIPQGNSTTLTLVPRGGAGASASIDGVAVPAGGGSRVITPASTATHIGSVTGPDGRSATCEVVVTVLPTVPRRIRFTGFSVGARNQSCLSISVNGGPLVPVGCNMPAGGRLGTFVETTFNVLPSPNCNRIRMRFDVYAEFSGWNFFLCKDTTNADAFCGSGTYPDMAPRTFRFQADNRPRNGVIHARVNDNWDSDFDDWDMRLEDAGTGVKAILGIQNAGANDCP